MTIDLAPRTPTAERLRELAVAAHRSTPMPFELRSFRAPSDPRVSWGLRLLMALPYLVVAIVSGFAAPVAGTPNALLLEHAKSIRFDSADVAWIGALYPPITTLVAAFVPGGALGLAVIGALVAGVVLKALFTTMLERGFAISTAIVAVAALGANPLFAYTVTQNLPAFIGLAAFGLALRDMNRFAATRDTTSIFTGGILLLIAALSDTSGLISVLLAAVLAPVLAIGHRGPRGSTAAGVVVLLFPSVASFAGVGLLAFLFTGNPFAAFGRVLNSSDPQVGVIAHLLDSSTGQYRLAVVAIVVVLAVLLRAPHVIAVVGLQLVAVLGGFALGAVPVTTAGNLFIITVVAAITVLPPPSTVRTTVVSNLLFAALGVLAWGAGFDRDVVVLWMHTLLHLA